MLSARFAAARMRVADGTLVSHGQHLPSQTGWLVCEARLSGERKYHLTNHPADTPRRVLGTRDQGVLGMRVGTLAVQGRTGSGLLRGPILAGAAQSCAANHDCVWLPAAPTSGHCFIGGTKSGIQFPGSTAAAILAGSTTGPYRRASLCHLRSVPSLQRHNSLRQREQHGRVVLNKASGTIRRSAIRRDCVKTLVGAEINVVRWIQEVNEN